MQMVSSGLVLDCFVHERKHQMLKRTGTAVKNTVTFEASVLSRVVLQQARQLKSLLVEDGLVGRTSQSSKVAVAFGAPTATVGRSLSCNGLAVGVGDVVLFDGQAGVVEACAAVAGRIYLLLSLLRRVAKHTCHTCILTGRVCI